MNQNETPVKQEGKGLMRPETLQAEWVNPYVQPHALKVAMIDFDGTVSLLREGWDQVMIPMMVRELLTLPGTTEPEGPLRQRVTDFVLKLNGQPTIVQMQALCKEVELRGGTPLKAEDYKARYLGLLMNQVKDRKAAIASTGKADTWTVPGTRQLLDGLQKRKIPMLLASGTDLQDLRTEAELLQVARYFGEGIEGPESDASSFTKADACDRMLTRHQLPGSALLNIGDGYVETKVAKERGGIAVGIAYDHDHPGEFNSWRREQLHRAGVDLILPDLKQSELLLTWLLEGHAS
jgi:phosphoglycolate phosphatase